MLKFLNIFIKFNGIYIIYINENDMKAIIRLGKWHLHYLYK